MLFLFLKTSEKSRRDFMKKAIEEGHCTDLGSPFETFLKRLFLWNINATMTCYTTTLRKFRIPYPHSMSSERATHNFCTNLYFLWYINPIKRGKKSKSQFLTKNPMEKVLNHCYELLKLLQFLVHIGVVPLIYLQNCARPALRTGSKVVRFYIPVS